MIWESSYWKNELINDIRVIERWSLKPPSGRREFILEKKIFVSAFAVRRLMESYKLTDAVRAHTIRCSTFPAIKEAPIDAMWRHPDKHYDFNLGRSSSLGLGEIAKLIIHS